MKNSHSDTKYSNIEHTEKKYSEKKYSEKKHSDNSHLANTAEQDIPVKIQTAAQWIREANHVVALTGAGISVDSGIPDFRGKNGIWSRFDPMEYAVISAFEKNPRKIWRFLKSLYDDLTGKEPNWGHLAFAAMENQGFLHALITQNVDGLHQKAGSKEVFEVHGNGESFVCIHCDEVWDRDSREIHWDKEEIPLCPICDFPLKPNIIFFGEPLPHFAVQQSKEHTQQADVLIVAATSVQVTPVSQIPRLLPKKGRIIEINLAPTSLTYRRTNLFIQASTTDIVPLIAQKLSEYKTTSHL